jgi:hypothetical protein
MDIVIYSSVGETSKTSTEKDASGVPSVGGCYATAHRGKQGKRERHYSLDECLIDQTHSQRSSRHDVYPESNTPLKKSNSKDENHRQLLSKQKTPRVYSWCPCPIRGKNYLWLLFAFKQGRALSYIGQIIKPRIPIDLHTILGFTISLKEPLYNITNRQTVKILTLSLRDLRTLKEKTTRDMILRVNYRIPYLLEKQLLLFQIS